MQGGGGGGGGGAGGHGGHGLCGIGLLHCPGDGSDGQNVTPGCPWHGCGVVVHGLPLTAAAGSWLRAEAVALVATGRIITVGHPSGGQLRSTCPLQRHGCPFGTLGLEFGGHSTRSTGFAEPLR